MTWLLGLLVILAALSAAGMLAIWHEVLMLREAVAQTRREVVVVQVGAERGHPPDTAPPDRDLSTVGSGRERLRQRLQQRQQESHV